jgi:hypothetical protein
MNRAESEEAKPATITTFVRHAPFAHDTSIDDPHPHNWGFGGIFSKHCECICQVPLPMPCIELVTANSRLCQRLHFPLTKRNVVYYSRPCDRDSH